MIPSTWYLLEIADQLRARGAQAVKTPLIYRVALPCDARVWGRIAEEARPAVMGEVDAA
jgi:hypothetical protein